MQSTSRIIFFLVLAVVVAGLGFLMWSFLRPSVSPTDQSIGGGTTNIQTTVTTPVRVSSQAASTTVDTTDSSLSIINSAKEILFTSIHSVSTSSAGTVYSLYKDDVAISKSLYPVETNFPIDTALVDLNQDGVPEVIVYENLPGFCGSGGCVLDIYQYRQTGWAKIGSAFGGENTERTNKITNGYFDLLLSVSNDMGSQVNITQFAWDGSQYKPGKILGTRSGTSFIAQ